MADKVFYVAQMSKVLVASGQDTLQYTPGPTETFYIEEWRWDSTGTFDIIDIRNSEQFKYTQCSVTNPIPSKFVQDPDNAFLAWRKFNTPLIIRPSMTFSVDVKDTSAAGNTVRAILIGYKEVGGRV